MKREKILGNQEIILNNQKKLDQILANQKIIMSTIGAKPSK